MQLPVSTQTEKAKVEFVVYLMGVIFPKISGPKSTDALFYMKYTDAFVRVDFRKDEFARIW